ncbi:MAG: type II toxin-antitoxin system Phd/YefM family antitoxin [Chloroflexota bacterium]
MPKTISVSEAKNRLSAILEWAVEHEDEVVVESRGEPKAVIMAYGEYEALLDLRVLQMLQVPVTSRRDRDPGKNWKC